MEGALAGQWRPAAPRPLLGAALVPAAGQAPQAAPGRSLRLRPEPRRHRRALVRLHHAGRQREPHAGRRPELRRRRQGSASPCATPSPRCGATLIGKTIWNKYKKWPVYSKFFDNMGPIPHHMHQSAEAGRAGRPGRQAGVATTSRRSTTTSATTSPTPSWASSPARPRRRSASAWRTGTRATTASSISRKAYRLKPGTGWLIAAVHPARARLALHLRAAVGLRRLRHVPDRSSKAARCRGRCSSRTCPRSKHQDLDFIVEQLDWEANVDPNFKDNHYLEPIPVADTRKRRLRRPLDRLRQGRRRAALHRQGTDRRSRREVHDQGQRRLRPDLRAGRAARSTS